MLTTQMTHLLVGFATSSISGVLHLFPSFPLHSPESLVGPSSPAPRTVCQPPASSQVCGHPFPLTWALPACLLSPCCCLIPHTPPHRRGCCPGTAHRSIWMLMERCCNTQSECAQEGWKQVIAASVGLFFTGMQCQGERVTFFPFDWNVFKSILP